MEIKMKNTRNQNKDDMPILGAITLLLLSGAIILTIVWCVLHLLAAVLHPLADYFTVTADEVYVQSQTSTECFKVEIVEVLKEKGKEDTYVVEMKHFNTNEDLIDTRKDCKITLSKSDYNSMIGEESNFVTSEVYETAAYTDRMFLGFNLLSHKLITYRYSILGEIPMPESEKAQLALSALNVWNKGNKHMEELQEDCYVNTTHTLFAMPFLGFDDYE